MKKYSIFISLFLLHFLSSKLLYAQPINVKTEYFSGSGFFISKQGHIATNAHVIQKCDKNKIYVLENEQDNVKSNLKHIATDVTNDLAILQAPERNHKNIFFSSEPELLKAQETVYMAGYPHKTSHLNFKKTSFKKYQEYSDIDTKQKKISLLFDNVARHGNSGGPLLDKSGNLVGIVQGMASVTQGDILQKSESLSIAIPIIKLENLMTKNAIYPHKQFSRFVKNDAYIQNDAREYMVRVVCH
jgi:S1-C subfamily serine protease